MNRPVAESSSVAATGRWMALTAALLGWMFDGAEMGVFSLVGRPALRDLFEQEARAAQGEADVTSPSGTKNPADLQAAADAREKQLNDKVGVWFSVIIAGFLVGAATGGVLFGWLGDRIGRVRAMTLSVLAYAVFTGLCGFATTAWQVAALRFIAALGMGGEWSLGVALVMEVWPNRSRAFMAGLIGAAANVGYLLVGWVSLGMLSALDSIQAGLLSLGLSESLVQSLARNGGWRLMMMVCAAPALLTFFIRLFVPESERWKHEQTAGRTSHWATADLLGVVLGAIGPVLMIVVWAGDFGAGLRLAVTIGGLLLAIVGYTYPVTRYLQRLAKQDGGRAAAWQPIFRRMLLGAGLGGVALLGTWGSTQWAPSWADELTKSDAALRAKEHTQIWLAWGAITGTILAALIGDWLGRRWTYFLLCGLSILAVLWLFRGHTSYEDPTFLVATFTAGLVTASFYGWLPLYLPELFGTNVRATGQGFAFNFGRIIAAVGALQVGSLFKTKFEFQGELYGGFAFACSAAGLIYLVGMVLIWFAPETKGRPLPD